MAIGSAQLSESLQTLIDTRLDTIDRMLLGRVPRADRLAIVSEVESQVFELLSGRDTEALTREDVLAVLARLDPPEAYLPEPGEGEATAPRKAVATRVSRPALAGKARAARVSGILGVIALVLVLLGPVLIARGFGSPRIAGTFLLVLVQVYLTVLILSGLSLIQAARSRLKDAWAVTGLITGLIALLLAIGEAFLIVLDVTSQ